MKRDGKWLWEAVGNDANTAHLKMLAGPIPLIASKAQDKESGTPTAKDGYRIDDEIAVSLSNAAKLSSKTYKAYKCSLELFRQSCKKIYVPSGHTSSSVRLS